ncbi:MAG: N-acetylmuramoyl-L-alanine amidase, partial [Amphiplicatus sp.]
MNIIDSPSPNFDERGRAVDTVILHYTGMQNGADALARLCDPAAKVSAHYLVEEDGVIYRLVAEEKRAWHAGVSSWKGESDVNARSIGIEIVNPGHEWGYRDF